MRDVAVGIDLGTTNSVVAYVDDFERPIVVRNEWGATTTPSIVMASDGNTIVGAEARRQIPLKPQAVAQFFKRDMGTTETYQLDGTPWSPVRLSSAVLRVLASDATRELGTPVRRAVVTVPAYFRDAARRATMEATREAGLEALAILNEPVAAARAFGIRPGAAPSGDVFVFDLGGGTFDVTLVRVSATELIVVGHDGNHLLGGKDWDEVIVRDLATSYQDKHGVSPLDDLFAFQELYVRAEELKRALSAQAGASVTYTYGGKSERFEMTRQHFEELSRHLVEATIAKCEDLLQATGVMKRSVGTVLMVGGSTRLPMVRAAVERYFGMRPNFTLNPDECVATGAAIHAWWLTRPPAKSLPGSPTKGLPAQKLRDAIAHSLGLVVIAGDGSRYENAIILPRNSAIPIKRTETKVVHAPREGGGTLEVWLTQGQSKDPCDNEGLSKRVFRGVPHRPNGTEVEITYAYDANGVVDVCARVKGGAALTLESIDGKASDLSWTRRAPPRARGSLRIGVTNKAYDNIGAILSAMGIEHQPFVSYDVRYDLVFVNCLSNYPDPVQTRAFVEGGGVLYASDYAESLLRDAFPGCFEITSASRGKATLRVESKELRDAVGSQLTVELDTAWKQITQTGPDVEVLLRVASSDVVAEGIPIMVSFTCGQGRVFFTSFHNSAQAGREQQNLLRALVIKQLSVATGVPFEQLASTRGYLL